MTTEAAIALAKLEDEHLFDLPDEMLEALRILASEAAHLQVELKEYQGALLTAVQANNGYSLLNTNLSEEAARLRKELLATQAALCEEEFRRKVAEQKSTLLRVVAALIGEELEREFEKWFESPPTVFAFPLLRRADAMAAFQAGVDAHIKTCVPDYTNLVGNSDGTYKGGR